MARNGTEDPSMTKIREAIKGSGLSRRQIGLKMGFAPTVARQTVSQLLRARNPQIGTIRRLAKALGVRLESLL